MLNLITFKTIRFLTLLTSKIILNNFDSIPESFQIKKV